MILDDIFDEFRRDLVVVAASLRSTLRPVAGLKFTAALTR